MTAGRPTDYDPAFCEQVIELGKDGKSKAQMAATLGVSRQTMDTWTKVHPEFLDAVKDAQELALAWWEDAGQKGLTADKFNATAFIFQVKNRFRGEYADVQDVRHSGHIANMTPEQRAARLAELEARRHDRSGGG